MMGELQSKFGVQVYVTDKPSGSGNLDTRKVVLIGKVLADLHLAKEEINFKREHISIDSDLIEYICGANDSNLRYFE